MAAAAQRQRQAKGRMASRARRQRRAASRRSGRSSALRTLGAALAACSSSRSSLRLKSCMHACALAGPLRAYAVHCARPTWPSPPPRPRAGPHTMLGRQEHSAHEQADPLPDGLMRHWYMYSTCSVHVCTCTPPCSPLVPHGGHRLPPPPPLPVGPGCPRCTPTPSCWAWS